MWYNILEVPKALKIVLSSDTCWTSRPVCLIPYPCTKVWIISIVNWFVPVHLSWSLRNQRVFLVVDFFLNPHRS